MATTVMATKVFGTWVCNECDNNTIHISYQHLADYGSPVCGKCDADMTFRSDLPLTIDRRN
jgi:hypothetical protein